MPRLILILLVATPLGAAEPVYSDLERSHWSFVPRESVSVPWPDDPALLAGTRTPVDAFIVRQLGDAGLRPTAMAERRTLIRRLTFDLTGLPPSPEEVAAFTRNDSPHATADLIDRLLASPRYGEQWGQHWLDVVRYAESEGFEYDRTVLGAWRFRDYVIDAFNTDKPFDRFVVEQVAGDELDAETLEPKIAAGFHRLGPVRRNAGNQNVSFSRNEVLTERTNIIGAVFLGMTIGCARCHDHMFDPIRQEDYYRFQAFLAGTYEYNFPLSSEADLQEREDSTKQVTERMARTKTLLQGQLPKQREDELRKELTELEKQLPPPLPVIATVKEQADERTPIHVLQRGDGQRPLQQVGPRYPGVLLPEDSLSWPPETAAPKTKLAHWIADGQNPLTARVIANRIWHYHFGQGLVPTGNDFGANGQSPSHPELLDYLANELIEHDWSIKALHRLILYSATYQQASTSRDPRGVRVDPENSLLWRFPRRRLAAQELRDAMLAVSGQMDRRMHGESVMVPVESDLIDLLYKPSQWQVAPDQADHHRRSIYLIAKRNLRLPFMQVFDQPDLQSSCPSRESSTHAPQSLELLNGKLSNSLAAAMAERLEAEASPSVTAQVQRGFELAIGRGPTSAEMALAIQFLEKNPLSEFTLALFNLNSFLYVE
jgi:hypothetical protein